MQAATGAGGLGWFTHDPRPTAELPPVPPECARLLADYPQWRPWKAQADGPDAYRARLTTDPDRPQWEVLGQDLAHLGRLVSHYDGVLAPSRLGRGAKPTGPGAPGPGRR